MTDTAAVPSDVPAAGRAAARTPLVLALREGAIAFALAMALFGSLVGFKTEGGLELTYHFGKAALLAAAVGGARFLADIIFWRPADGGRRAAAIMGFLRRLKWPAVFGSLIAGFLLYAIGGLRSDLIASAAGVSWLVGILTDLVTFACIAVFIITAMMAATRIARIVLKRTPLASLPYELSQSFSRELPFALLVVAILLPFLIAGPPQRYAVDTATQILIYIMLGWGLNVVVGLAGLLDLGYVAFYAVGAYTYALISTQYGWPFWACLPVAGLLAALWGMTLGFPVLRLRGDYLAIVTLAFGEIIRIVLINWESLTGGPSGINRIPRPGFFGLPFDRSANSFHSFFGLDFNPVHRIIFLYYLILALALATNFVTLRLRRLPIGRAWEALREDEIACRSLGINTVTAKLTAFAIGAMFGGFAGAFFAARQGFISPESFTFNESALVLAIVVLGGLGSQLGVVIAAVILVGSAERFRELQDYRMLIFGLSMVLVMILRPRGLMSGRTPSASLAETRTISSSFVKEGRG